MYLHMTPLTGLGHAGRMINPKRIHKLNDRDIVADRDHIIYWMQSAQRTQHNEALAYSIAQANEHKKKLIVVFLLNANYPDARAPHFRFMIEGLKDIEAALKKLNIKFLIQKADFESGLHDFYNDAALIITDGAYLKHLRKARKQLAQSFDAAFIEVETNLVVPVEEVTDKQEYAARTIRPKLMSKYKTFLDDFELPKLLGATKNLPMKSEIDISSSIEDILNELGFKESEISEAYPYTGGQNQAQEFLSDFNQDVIDDYDEKRSEILGQHISWLSAYLHFGMISPVDIIQQILAKHSLHKNGVKSFIEELLVRRELAHNFVYFNKDYDSYKALPDWCKKTLAKHKDDKRKPQYSQSQLEECKTHDEYWNASMACMKKRGYLHNSLRMYWGKKILEWSSSPEYAYKVAIKLNNKYFLDGRDANSYANILWCFGLHDRPWGERDIFGMVRYLSQNNVKKKMGGEDGLREFKEKFLN